VLGDIDWYRRRAKTVGGPVLELGAGTGRITIPIAEDGVTIHALDASAEMLGVLRRKVASLSDDVRGRITITEADMRSFELAEKFALVICPFRAFLHNLTDDDRLACLGRVRAHLRPGGRLAFNVFHPSLEVMARNVSALGGVWRWTKTLPHGDGGHLVCSEATRYDTVRQRLHSQHRYEVYGADGNLTRTFLHQLELAYLYQGDVRGLLRQAGFGSIHIAGAADGRPVENDTDELFVEATVE
jgi:SAM-dependent methyltransferase